MGVVVSAHKEQDMSPAIRDRVKTYEGSNVVTGVLPRSLFLRRATNN